MVFSFENEGQFRMVAEVLAETLLRFPPVAMVFGTLNLFTAMPVTRRLMDYLRQGLPLTNSSTHSNSLRPTP